MKYKIYPKKTRYEIKDIVRWNRQNWMVVSIARDWIYPGLVEPSVNWITKSMITAVKVLKCGTLDVTKKLYFEIEEGKP